MKNQSESIKMERTESKSIRPRKSLGWSYAVAWQLRLGKRIPRVPENALN
jgi:hypothetical protein